MCINELIGPKNAMTLNSQEHMNYHHRKINDKIVVKSPKKAASIAILWKAIRLNMK